MSIKIAGQEIGGNIQRKVKEESRGCGEDQATG
jgi:hypothetical protein